MQETTTTRETRVMSWQVEVARIIFSSNAAYMVVAAFIIAYGLYLNANSLEKLPDAVNNMAIQVAGLNASFSENTLTLKEINKRTERNEKRLKILLKKNGVQDDFSDY